MVMPSMIWPEAEVSVSSSGAVPVTLTVSETAPISMVTLMRGDSLVRSVMPSRT